MPRWVDQLAEIEPMEPEEALRELIHASMRSQSELLKLEMDAAMGRFEHNLVVPFADICPTCKAVASKVATCGICGKGTPLVSTADYFNCDICPGCGMTGTQAVERGGCRCSKPARVRAFPEARAFDIMTAWENL